MQRRHLVFLVLALAGCGRRSGPAAQQKRPAIGWRPIGSWSGHGNAQTESFDIGSGAWRIKWEAKNEPSPGDGHLLIMVHSAVSGRPLMQALDHRGAGSGIAYVGDDPRLFHMVIESNEDWSLTVEEAVTAAP